jgi:hypothetical protein
MDLDTQAAAMSRQEIALLLKAYQELKLSHDELAQRVTWFERQLFGAKSERRLVDPAKTQLNLGETAPARAADVRTTEVASQPERQRLTTKTCALMPRFPSRRSSWTIRRTRPSTCRSARR